MKTLYQIIVYQQKIYKFLGYIQIMTKKKEEFFLPSKYKAGSRQSSSKINQKEKFYKKMGLKFFMQREFCNQRLGSLKNSYFGYL